MKTLNYHFWLLLLAPTLGCSSGNLAENPYIKKDWAQDKLWDDGQAELSIYDATRTVYDKPRSFEYVFITVKEDFNKEFQVKTDDYNRDDLFPVIKVNKSCRIETQIYPYYYLTSLFFKRDSPETLYKLSNTSQDWCGNTAKLFQEKGSQYTFDYMSYFDGEGNGETKVKKGPWFEDQLSYTLRALKFEDQLNFDIELYPTQITNNAKVPESMKGGVMITRPGKEDLSGVADSLINDPWKIIITTNENPPLEFWINGSYPNHVLKMNLSHGQQLILKKTYRDAYWSYE